MTLAAGLAGALERDSGRRVTDARRVGGGDINDAYRVALDDGTVAFVKTRADAPAGEYAAEAAALGWLGEPAALLVPEVVAVGDPPEDAGAAAGPRFLALGWVETGSLSAAGQEELGRGLAHMHGAGAAAFGAPPPGAPASGCGGVAPLRLGHLELSNEPLADWPTFYAERRLRPLVALARDRGALSSEAARAVEGVCGRIERLAGPAEPVARLHGDLWGGNVLAGNDGRPRLIDPAAYGGHREVDLAMLRLFGIPSPRTMTAYDEAWPLADGHEQRVGLWQLFPLLVHAALFGGSYGRAVQSTAQRYR